MDFGQLLEIEQEAERTDAIRRAFAPFTEPLDVTGLEEQAAIVLVNLSLKRADVFDLLAKRLAVNTLKDEKHVRACLSEMRWLHTHNLKYPDSRVAGQRLVSTMLETVSGYISSAGLPLMQGWSHNSSAVNKAKLFGSMFRWNGQVFNLAQLVAEDNVVWRKALMSLSIRAKQVREWGEQLSPLMSPAAVPEAVSNYSPQVRLPYRGGYIAVTPVVSHAVLCKLQNLRVEHKGHFEQFKHEHAANVGDLPASLGGYVSVLSYPPPVWASSRLTLHQSRASRVGTGKEVLDIGAILSRDFLAALQRLIDSHKSLTRHDRRRSRVASLRVIQKSLKDWVAPVLEWRDAYQEGKKVADGLDSESLEYRLICSQLSGFISFLSPLNQRLHHYLQSHRKAEKYAYHPAILEPLNSQIRALLNGFATMEAGDASIITEVKYIHLEGLRAYDARSLANPYLNGIPSLTAMWGLVHAFERRINELIGVDVRLSGAAWFIRSYSRVPGKKLPEPAMLKRDGQSVSRPGIIDSKHCDLVMDIVVRVTPGGTGALSECDMNFIQAAFPSSFAGGCLHPPSLYENKSWCQLYSDTQGLFAKLSRLPRNGCWVYPGEQRCRSFDDLLLKTGLNPSLKPAMLGYGLLGEPLPRDGSIEPLHAFSEPITGVVRCLSPVEVRMKGADNFYRSAFWGLRVNEGAMLMEKA
tara:strand:- start:2429 stop:4507 length:2079 start_codon:yes stop_codon:yes gene_type:complete